MIIYICNRNGCVRIRSISSVLEREGLVMQACKAYYDNGRFIPIGFGKLPEGTKAIITLLEEIPKGIDERLKDFDAITQAIESAEDEEMPILEPIRLREVKL
jgi:predicted DNA-binding antitoxin AbrB/MazE fold protein